MIEIIHGDANDGDYDKMAILALRVLRCMMQYTYYLKKPLMDANKQSSLLMLFRKLAHDYHNSLAANNNQYVATANSQGIVTFVINQESNKHEEIHQMQKNEDNSLSKLAQELINMAKHMSSA